MDFDDILDVIGPFGKYQKLTVFLVVQAALFPCGFLTYNAVFFAAVPGDYWCKIPALENATVNVTTKHFWPPDEHNGTLQGHSRCFMYDLNYSALSLSDISELTNGSLSSHKTVPCQFGWEFDRSVFQDTIVTEYLLICDRSLLQALSLALVTMGGVFGPLVFGFLADHFGRKKGYFIMIAFQSVFSVLTSFSHTFELYCVCRFMVGSTLSFSYTLPLMQSIEITGRDTRVLISTVCSFGYTMSVVIVIGIAYFIRTWRLLALVTACPMLLIFGLWFFYPESPRWLLAKGRYDELEALLRHIARVNGVQLTPEFDVALPKLLRDIESEEQSQKYSAADLFRSPNLRKKTLILILINFCNLGVFLGLNYYAPVFGDDPHLNSFLTAVIELPPYIFATFVCNKFGRRLCLVIGMGLAAASSISAVGVPGDVTAAIMALSLSTKFFITLTFLIGELLEDEIFPTVVRAEGHSVTSLLASIAGCLAPFIVHLGYSYVILPLAVFGGLCVVAGFFALFLPETASTDLPQTLKDGERIGKNMSWGDVFSFRLPTTKYSIPAASMHDPVQLHNAKIRKRRGQKERRGLLPTTATSV
ncbi:beta-alanine transporter-like [Paramacrobiotus metropolitanus]|uniref:beta-alanine transporter-like n=1 Tax=Paramacrobiotus metropolitanus TaxID=2943436 RepID=UPI0024464702|nr:beta-alanine transporter-like [Paramacrobiotus metropolitanus]